MKTTKEINREIKRLQALKPSAHARELNLRVGQEIYEVVPRWGDLDYHPQIIEKIENNNVHLYEKSINRRTVVPVTSIHYDSKEKIYTH